MATITSYIPVNCKPRNPIAAKMWAFQYQPLLNSLLQKALVELCTQSLPWEGRLEIDGIFCVSGKDPSQQIVIKIHKALEKPEPKKNLSRSNKNPPNGGKKVHIEDGKIVSSEQKIAPKKSPNMPLNLSLPNLKSGGSVTQNSGVPISSSNYAALQKSLGVGSQSLRALLGTKPLGMEASALDTDDRSKPTILKQPNAPWLRKEGEDSQSFETGSETGSEKRELQDYFTNIKEEPLDMAESESSLDLDEETLPATNVTCKICNVKYENFATLQAHTLQMHKRYACRQCCNTFSLRCNLRRHERLHAGVKPHTCRLCRKSFSRTADLKAHIRKHAEDNTMPDLISCSKCPKAFRTAVNLRLHMYKVHKEKDCVYACSICEKVYHDPDEFQQHREAHRASLMHAGLSNNTESSCSTPLLNGSQDSMDEDDMDNDMMSDDENFNKEIDLSMNPTNKASFLHKMAMRAQSQISMNNAQLNSQSHELSGEHSPTQDGDDIDLYFGSPLVIKEENDSQDSENMKRSNRRKSKPSKVTSQSTAADIEDDTENLAPLSNVGTPDTVATDDGVPNGEGGRSHKREAQGDWTCQDYSMQDAKRPRLHADDMLDNFTMANQSLEDIMKQVNENLYKNKDVLIAEEKEKETESKGKKATGKAKTKKMPTIRLPTTVPFLQPKPDAPAVGNKPPLVLFVTGSSTPKVAIAPNTPSPLRVNIKKDMNATWSVSPKTGIREKRTHTGNVCLSPILPHNLSLSGSTDDTTYTCSQWGCNYTCLGFPGFEDHTLSTHGRYPCKFCSQTFTGRNNRTRHIRYHITGKQHQCNECGKYFARPDSLKEHRFIHTRSYRDSKCVNCKVLFEKKATLLSHMKKCFSDEQLDTDKVPPEEIEKDKDAKRGQTNTPKAKVQPPQPSDIGVMKAEYIKQETEKILNVKKYLDNVIEIAPIPEGSDLPAVPHGANPSLPLLQMVSPSIPVSTSQTDQLTAPVLTKSSPQPREDSGQESDPVPEGVDNYDMAALSPEAAVVAKLSPVGAETPSYDSDNTQDIDQPMVIDEEENVMVIDLDKKKQDEETVAVVEGTDPEDDMTADDGEVSGSEMATEGSGSPAEEG